MAIAKVQSINSSGANPQLTSVVAGNLLVLCSSCFNSGSVTAETVPTDSAGTFSTQDRLVAANGASGIVCSVFYEESAAAGTHTATPQNFGAGSQNRTFAEFSGIASSSSLDVKTSAATSNSTHTSQATGTTGATNQADELIVIALSLGASGGVADVGFTDPVAGFTTLQKVVNDSSDEATFHAFKVVAATGTQAATFNWTDAEAGQTSQALIGTYKAAAASVVNQSPLTGSKPLLMTLQRDASKLRAMPIPSYVRDAIPPDVGPPAPWYAQHPILARFERSFGRTRMGHLPMAPVAAAAALVLTADPGSVVITGTAANFLLAMPAGSGVITITGTDITPRLSMPAAAGAFTITGTVASLLAARTIVAGPGSYVITGTAATPRVSMPADPGSFTITGTAATFAVVMPASSGTVLITGTAATLTPSAATPTLVADPGSVSISGSAAALRVDGRLVADAGEVLISGSAATLILTPLGQASTIDGAGLRFTGRRRAPERKRTPEDIAREQKMVQDYLDELERKSTAPAVTGAPEHPLVDRLVDAAAAPVVPRLHTVARVNALQRMAELEEEALEAERNEQQQQRRRAAASAVLLMSY